MLHFDNNWEVFFFLGAVFWYISLALAVLALYWGVRLLRRSKKRLLGSLLVVISIPLFMMGGTGGSEVLKMKIDAYKINQQYKAHTWTLEESATVAGIPLAKGSQIHFNYDVDMNQKEQMDLSNISSIDLVEPTEILGVTVEENFSIINRGWQTQLAFEQEISGFPIKKGVIKLTSTGDLKEGICAKTFTLLGTTIPKSALISLWDEDKNDYYIGDEDRFFVIRPQTGAVREL